MVDDTLLGAVERAIERKEKKASILESLTYLGYSQAEVEEAINLFSQKEREMPVEKAPEQKELVAKQIKKKSGIKENVISALIAGFAMIICVAAFLTLRSPMKACKISTEMQKVIFGLSLSCNVIKIANIQAIIIFIVVFIVFLVSLLGKKFSR